jgi:hypothetical protein
VFSGINTIDAILQRPLIVPIRQTPSQLSFLGPQLFDQYQCLVPCRKVTQAIPCRKAALLRVAFIRSARLARIHGQRSHVEDKEGVVYLGMVTASSDQEHSEFTSIENVPVS